MMMATRQETVRLGRSDRFYQNPALRDAEWNRTKQAPWWLTALTLVVIGVAFFVGVYGGAAVRQAGWIVGALALAIYVALAVSRRRWARRHLRQVHGQTLEA